MESPTTPREEAFTNALALSKSEKLDILLKHEIRKERLRQRRSDINLDHPIALFSRQKTRSKGVVLLTLFLLTLIHGVQIIALYNYNILSGVMTNDNINDYIERQYWLPVNGSVQTADAGALYDEVRLLLGGSEVEMFDAMNKLGFCFSEYGYLVALFNTVVGLFFIYLFIFADVWKVIFATVITRNFPSDPHFKTSLAGTFWLVCVNAAILSWLGVEAGFNVVASHGDFYSVLLNSLSIFIILSLDETILPFVRFFIEDFRHLDAQGELTDEWLDILTHGNQYHKPGYGQKWGRNLTTGHPLLRLVAFLNIFVAAGIVVAPLAVTIYHCAVTFVRC